MTESTILITGAAGYLGRSIMPMARAHGRVHVGVHHITSSTASSARQVELDITDRTATMRLVERLAPTAIIHTAAVNPGQGDEEVMWRVNAEGSGNVAEAARAVGARLVAVSTDVVHDGTAAPYDDDVPPTSLNAYGRSKAAGEDAVRAQDPTAVIVRPSLIYGLAEMDRGTGSFVERIARGEPQTLFSDVIRNPVWVETLAEALIRLTTIDLAGTLNIAGSQPLTREAFGRRMLSYWEIDDRGLVVAGRASDISDSIPLDLRLRTGRAEALLGMAFPGVDEVLESSKPPKADDA
jgi:dTDP-4-dehydrorhamnose reductase